MKKIEQRMVEAVNTHAFWKEGNTMVHPSGDVYLHGNQLARVSGGEVKVNVYTLVLWPTNTTISRLRALGVNVSHKAGCVYLNDQPLDSRSLT